MKKRPDLARAEEALSSKVVRALREASEALDAIGVRHKVIGGIAVGAWGYPRATKDVDFMIGPEGVDITPGGLVTYKAGVPHEVGGVAVDVLYPEEGEDWLFDELEDEAAVVSIEALVYMKLKAGRRRDKIDVEELVRAGIDTASVGDYLHDRAPELAEEFDAIVDAVDEEARS